MELQFTKDLIKEAGALILRRQKDAKISYKAERDIVTEADLECEKFIVESIKEKFPNDLILSEENYKDTVVTSERIWVIDPIDGTVNYSRDLPFFGISIALVENKVPLIGCIYLPLFDELYWSKKGQGAFCNEDKINVSEVNQLDKSILCFGDSYGTTIYKDSDKKTTEFLAISEKVMRSRRLGCAVMESIFVACGKTDAYVCDAYFWDFAAAILLIEEAGGQVSRTNGTPYDPSQKDVILSNGKIHQELLEIF